MPVITANSFRKLKPDSKLYKVRGENLEYAVHPSGRVALTFVNRIDGKERRVKLYSSKLQPTKEQLKAINDAYQREARALVDGIDLDARKREAEQKAKIAAELADFDFGRLPDEYLLIGAAREYFIEFDREKVTGSTEKIYLRYIVKGYGKGKGKGVGLLQPEQVKRHHLQAILDDIKKAGKYRTANHVKKCMSRFWLWMSRRGFVESREPARDLDAKAPKPRDRLFTEEEMRDILCTDCHPAIWFQAYTALRRGEIVKARWEDVDDEGYITIVVKGGKKHIHYLTPQSQACSQTTSGYLFTGRHSSGPMLGNSLSEILRERFIDVGVKDATGHDWRSAFYSWGEMNGIADRILHACLSHTKQDLTGVYGLHSFRQEKRETLQDWADYLDGLCKVKKK